MKLQKAEKKQVKLRLGLSSPSGYGKTYSALLLAYGITNDWTKVAIIDTENNSANLYAHLGAFNVLSLSDPYSPERYVEAIKACENASIEVVIIDSITQEWNGEGGCLQIHKNLGGRFQDWGAVSILHQSFIDKILQSKCHIITTVRTKVNYSMERDTNGRTKVVKHGLKEITREGFEYELTVNFELINDKHLAKASKDRTGLFMNKPEFIINSATGKKLIQWCNNDSSIDQARKDIADCTTVEGLKHLYGKYNTIQKLIYPLIIKRKEEIGAVISQVIAKEAIVEPNKEKENGTIN